jgi:hypothetical protein
MRLRRAGAALTTAALIWLTAVCWSCTPDAAYANPQTTEDCDQWVKSMLGVLADKQAGVSLDDEITKAAVAISACSQSNASCYIHNDDDLKIYGAFIKAIYNVKDVDADALEDAVRTKCTNALPFTEDGKHPSIGS